MGAVKRLKILLVDDQTLMRDALETILNLEDDLEVVATAGNGLEAIEAAKTWQPDLILMDIQMPVMNGIESIRLIKEQMPEMTVLILTTFDEEEYIIEGLLHGAAGYLLKDIRGDKLVGSIREAVSGQLMLPAMVASRLAVRLHQLSMPAGGELNVERLRRQGVVLTGREREIAVLMTDGLNNREIANALFMSEGTVRNYISVIYSKIGINERAKAAVVLRELLESEAEAAASTEL